MPLLMVVMMAGVGISRFLMHECVNVRMREWMTNKPYNRLLACWCRFCKSNINKATCAPIRRKAYCTVRNINVILNSSLSFFLFLEKWRKKQYFYSKKHSDNTIQFLEWNSNCLVNYNPPFIAFWQDIVWSLTCSCICQETYFLSCLTANPNAAYLDD